MCPRRWPRPSRGSSIEPSILFYDPCPSRCPRRSADSCSGTSPTAFSPCRTRRTFRSPLSGRRRRTPQRSVVASSTSSRRRCSFHRALVPSHEPSRIPTSRHRSPRRTDSPRCLRVVYATIVPHSRTTCCTRSVLASTIDASLPIPRQRWNYSSNIPGKINRHVYVYIVYCVKYNTMYIYVHYIYYVL